ncbi:ABC transporter ATP-binding protein/permease [Nitratireductor aquibiodomus RA22]|uniref:ABC transporter ATP-binding protein/permease n=1 Tax=Nitratireductor aquibiodomus RA22 TaxID=1189611 RepID=I5C5B5_9HYPH|nr:ABC transporter ATP-binding protein [Nitratireductor aquibiodomus]EIM77017.1 ABC transporter ATP-binding protein/permease [Nitratireductor aquibiodomus RA22]
MMRTFIQLLGEDAPIFRRYIWMAVLYGLLSGLTIAALVPVLTRLLAGDAHGSALWLCVLLVGVVACWAWRRQVEKAGIGVGIAVLQGARHRIGDHVARLPIGWFTPKNTARLNHAVSNGMMEIAQLPAHVFTPVFSGAVTPVVIVVVLFALQWQMGLIALLALPMLSAVFVIAARFGRRADETYHRNAARTSQRMIEFAQAQSVLRAFNGEGGGTRFLEQAIDRQRRSGRELILLSTASVVLNSWVVQAVLAALLMVAVLDIQARLGAGLEAGPVIGLVVALLLSNRFVEPLLDVAGYGEALRGARNQLEAVREILAISPLAEPEAPREPKDASVELRNVTFRYVADQPPLLQGIDLKVDPGSMVALVGASGSGKTTLMRLVARFFDVESGSVLVGGVDVRHMTGERLAGQISQIFQDTYLFQGTIAENIRIGRPDASDAELAEAIRQAGVERIVARMPDGLETVVGEGGARLSGGERQRISIARALIKDAPILLIDEATAALDAENQAAIAETLSRLRGKRTLIVIAHQLSTVAMADRIVVLDAGQIREEGSHDALRAQDGLYARFLKQRQAAKGWHIAATP